MLRRLGNEKNFRHYPPLEDIRMRRYWKHVFCTAARQSVVFLFGSASRVLFAVINAAIIIWALSVWGSTDASSDERIVRTAIAIIGTAAFPLVFLYWIFRLPADWDDELRDQISKFEAQNVPRLTILCGKNEIYRHIPDKYDQHKQTYLRLGIKNLSQSETIEDVEVVFANVVSESGNYRTDPSKMLKFVDSGEFKTKIHPGDTKYFRVSKTNYSKYVSGKEEYFVTFGPMSTGGDYDTTGRGPFVVKLRISAKNLRVGIVKCRIDFDDEKFGICDVINSTPAEDVA